MVMRVEPARQLSRAQAQVGPIPQHYMGRVGMGTFVRDLGRNNWELELAEETELHCLKE